ncbi:TIGR04283 family arsenosugar biosynthesis glycosyltransferase [candidate division KSB1 bacterium]|nr:TIGR04283 family arsenosugar biosynthesis glycosyltransferase [candidate division KSB1 bacterium]
MQPKLSIIIPVLNEETTLPKLLIDIEFCKRNLNFPLECIVIDGGSEDRSFEVCREYDISVIQGPRGRGQQLAYGAQKSSGEVLLFLHADCRISPEHCLNAVETVQGNGHIAGGFILKFDDRHPILKLAEWINKIRFRFTKIFYGDHGIFLSREYYLATGGFPPQSLFEDVEMSRRLKKMGDMVLIAPPVITSSRRFRAGGVMRTFLKMASLHILYWVGVSPERLAVWYRKT